LFGDRGLERSQCVGGDHLVLGAEVPHHGGGDPGQVRLALHDAVERHCRADLVPELGGHGDDEAPAHAETHRAHGLRGHRVVGEQEVDRASEVAGSLLHRQLLHELTGFGGVVGGAAAV